MIGAIFRAMCLELARDRGALLLTFALPGIFFVIFAQIFTATASGDLIITTAVADEARSASSARLLEALQASSRLRVLPPEDATAASVASRVRRGEADAGLIIRRAANDLPMASPDDADRPAVTAERSSPGGSQSERTGSPPRKPAFDILLLTDPARGAAARMLAGELQRTAAELFSQAPAEAPQQAGLQVTERNVFGTAHALPQVAYAAGAVSFMFLLFASSSGAMSLMEERESGIVDRVLAGPGGIDVLVAGKFLYLLAQGVLQVGVIFMVAWLGYGVALPAHLGEWLVVTVCAATAAAGLAMLLVTASATRRQAQTTSTLVILVISAIGGSMVPRYVMPPTFQSLGWMTPNTWAVEAYSGIFWRQLGLADVALPCAVLLASGLVALALAIGLARLRARR